MSIYSLVSAPIASPLVETKPHPDAGYMSVQRGDGAYATVEPTGVLHWTTYPDANGNTQPGAWERFEEGANGLIAVRDEQVYTIIAVLKS